jgi:hypothetical protein
LSFDIKESFINSALLVHETVKRVEEAVSGMQVADEAAKNGKL